MDPVQEDVEHRRRSYESAAFDVEDADPDPIVQFERWYAEAADAGLTEPNAMALATVDERGRPQSRIVLLRGIGPDGFRFYTNLESAKGRELAAHPYASLTFGWLDLHRQVRVSGPVRRLAAEDEDAYFATRPRGHRLGAWASPQSDVLAGRDELERLFTDVDDRFAGVEDVPRPPFWGGYLVEPETIEFWQGRVNRLHDRLRYRRADGAWVIERLAP
jgi:pyridoxamine 5'-phosphate oxidase